MCAVGTTWRIWRQQCALDARSDCKLESRSLSGTVCFRDNVEDALGKMQACIDSAAQSLIPAEVDPEKVKQIAKQ